MAAGDADEKLIAFHTQRGEGLRTDRSNFEAQWQEAAARVLPAYKNTFFTPGNYPSVGQKNTEQQYDGRAGMACMRFASVIESLATPQNSIWHRLRAASKRLKQNKQVKVFFDDTTDALFSYRYRPVANYVGNSQQAYLGIGAFGNGTLYVDQPDDQPGLRYRAIHIGEIYFTESHAGVINGAYRYFELTAAQAVEKFGVANLPEEIVKMIDQPSAANTKYKFLHVVCENANYNPSIVTAKGMRYSSIYIATAHKKVVRRGGFRTWPYPTSRYMQAPGEIYGRGPAQIVLPSIKLLNEQKRQVITQGHRALSPTLLAYDDGALDGFSLRPGYLNKGGVNKDGRPLVQTLPFGNLALGDKMMDMELNIINDGFLVTLFQILVDSPQMTATEVLERAREKGMLLAPTAGRMQSEFLGAQITRELDLLGQQGLLPQIPDQLLEEGGLYVVEYDSPMSRMQRAEKAAGFMRGYNTAAEIAKATGDLSAMDWFDVDTAMPEMLDIQGAPAEWVADPDAVAAKRAQRAQQQQQEQMMNAAPGMAAVAKAVPQIAQGQGQ